ncbi:hypothetical protein KM043_018170 [Ampulex compressa]|nr:hypothetical protein KM043_018170 [Ampulex compressa]
MSDIKSVLILLCKHLKLSVNVDFKPEYFRLAKLNDSAEYVKEVLWSALKVLSYHVVTELYAEADFSQYDTLLSAKLCLAYLNYPVIEFYGFTKESNNTKQLLLAFAWLLATQDPLHIAVRKCLSNSVLGSECSGYDITQENASEKLTMSSMTSEINNIIRINGQVNYNLKEIVELAFTRAKLLKRSHTASTNVSGIPHLSIAELALTKRVKNINKGTYSSEDLEKIKGLRKIGNLLKIHLKWVQKENIFFNWMATVTQEHNNSLDDLQELNYHEVLRFISFLKCITKEKYDTVYCNISHESINSLTECTSRLVKVKNSNTEIDNWLQESTFWLNQETEDLHKKKDEVSKELKMLLSSIPFCIQI